MTTRLWTVPIVPITTIAALTLVSGALLSPVPAGAETIYGSILGGMALVKFDSATPGVVTPVGPFPAPSQVLALDFRPATGQLYGVRFSVTDSANRLVTVDTTTAALTPIGPPLPGGLTASTAFSFDRFADVIRIISSTGQNYLVDPDTGVATQVTSLPPGRWVAAIASSPAATLFGIEVQLDQLVRIGGVGGVPSPDTGTLAFVGPLNVAVGTPAAFDTASFDISVASGIAYAALSPSQFSPTTELYTVNLETGAATLVGSIGANFPGVNAIAVEPQAFPAVEIPAASGWALLALAATLAALGLWRLAAPTA